MKKTEALHIIGDFAEIIENPNDFDYEVIKENMQKTFEVLQEYPDLHKYLDSSFIRGLKKHYIPDLYSEYAKIFQEIIKAKANDEQKIYLTELADDNIQKKLRFNLEQAALGVEPKLLDEIFNNRLSYLYHQNEQNINPQIMDLLKFASDDEKCEQMLKMVFDERVSPKYRNENMTLIADVYHKFPQTINTAFEIIKKDKSNPQYFKLLADVALFDEYKAEEALSYMHSRVQEGPVDEPLLIEYYTELKKLSDALPKFKQLAQNYCREALISNKNGNKALKSAARLLGKEQDLFSQISIGKKVKKSKKNEYGYKKVQNIKANEVCVLFLGGNGTQDDKAAHGYIKPVVELLQENTMDNKVNVYGITYDFGDYFIAKQALEAQMKQYGHTPCHAPEFFENMHKDTQNPHFIKQLFNKFILPRISQMRGKVKLSADEAATNLNKLKIIAHCFGAYAALELEKMSLAKMKKLGYSDAESQKIQAQMQTIGINPYCPLGVQKSDMFSVISAQDRAVTHNNFFEKYIRLLVSKGKTIPLCLFEKKLGNFLLVNRMYGSDNRQNVEIDQDEHGYCGFKIVPTNSEKGKIAIKFMQNALINGLKSALRDEIRTLSTKDMLTKNSEERADFDMATKNAQKLYQDMVDYAFSKNKPMLRKK